MRTYTVKPEGIEVVRKRMLLFGAAFTVVVISSVWLLLPDINPLAFGITMLIVALVGGFAFRRGMQRLAETWPTYTLTVADDHILKQQSHYPDIRIGRDEVKSIQKVFTGEIAVKTRDWKKFIVIPRSLNGIEEVEAVLRQWKPVKTVPRAKTILLYLMPVLVGVLFLAAIRGYLRGGAPSPGVIFAVAIVILVLNLFVMRTVRRIPNLDERSKPKRWRSVLMIVSIVLLLLSLAVFYGLKR